MTHSVMRAWPPDGFAALGPLEDGPAEGLEAGARMEAKMPPDAHFCVSPEYKKREKIADASPATGAFVVSARLKESIEQLVDANDVEFLPVRIKDTAGRWIDGQFFILNPLVTLDVIDAEASGARFNSIDGSIMRVKKGLVMKPTDAKLFRPAKMIHAFVVRQDVADTLDAADLPGLSFVPADEFRG